MTTPAFVRRIALPTDLAEGSELVFAHGLALALHNHATLHLVHVRGAVERPDRWDQLPSVRELLVAWGHIRESAGSDALKALRMQVVIDEIVGNDTIVDTAREVAGLLPDLLVLGTHRRKGLARMLKGSVAERVARANRLPTLFLGHGEPGFVDPDTGRLDITKVVVPTGQDLSPAAALQLCARWLPDLGDGPFHLSLLHVGAPFAEPAPEVPVGLVASVRQRNHNTGDVVAGVVAEVELAEADLVIMATHGHDSWLDDIVGTKTEQLVRWCPCPVLMLPLG